MARYLLDTAALISFSKGFEPTRSAILALIDAGDDLGVCVVCVAEFYAGLRPAEQAEWDSFFSELTHWTTNGAAARQAGVWREQFARQGTPLATTDVLIAAVAHEYALTIITRNIKDFPMPELSVLSLA